MTTKLKLSKFKRFAEAAISRSKAISNYTDSDLKQLLSQENEVDFYAAMILLSKRSLGLEPYKVQIMAALSCSNGHVIDMKTGEGKTLVAAMSAVALVKKGYVVNVATANKYLADRDYFTMKPLYDACGVDVARLSGDSEGLKSAPVYYAHLTEEGCLSWLSDHLASEASSISHPQLLESAMTKTALIVDEIDHSLIDSSSVNYSIVSNLEIGNFYQQIAEMCKSVGKRSEFTQFDKNGDQEFTEEFYKSAEKILIEAGLVSNSADLYGDAYELMIHFRAAYMAFHILEESKDYVVKSGRIHRVDKKSGRLIEGGFLGTVAAYLSDKHCLEIPCSNLEVVSCALQHYVKSFDLLSGMSGTAILNALELKHSYGVSTLEIPRHQPTQRIDHGHILFPSDASLKHNVTQFLEKASRDQRPTLVVCANEAQAKIIADKLTQQSIRATLLTPSNVEEEAEILSHAGKLGSMIVTTRMCGRGTDIVCEDKARGLLIVVIGMGLTQNDDQQVIGRTGRQGAKGDSYFCISLDDEQFQSRSGATLANSLLANLVQEDMEHITPHISSATTRLIEKLQKQALSAMRERRKRVSIYNNPIDSQLKLLMKKRENILFTADPKAMLHQMAPAKVDSYQKLIDHYAFVFGGSEVLSYFIRKGMAEGLTKAWNRHHMSLMNIKMDTASNAQAASNINNFKKSCFEAFSQFAKTVNIDIFDYTLSYLNKEATKRMAQNTYLPSGIG
ncbi:hypothetical protein [Photobacterium galatheae]|uniref:preprotein translocase subunit SecA n=1 Tax=Photobacterium galatheae TaxID=1654360 RepID=UPI0009DC946F|nr:hypothetical protein [Photobacterium galatheae]